MFEERLDLARGCLVELVSGDCDQVEPGHDRNPVRVRHSPGDLWKTPAAWGGDIVSNQCDGLPDRGQVLIEDVAKLRSGHCLRRLLAPAAL